MRWGEKFQVLPNNCAKLQLLTMVRTAYFSKAVVYKTTIWVLSKKGIGTTGFTRPNKVNGKWKTLKEVLHWLPKHLLGHSPTVHLREKDCSLLLICPELLEKVWHNTVADIQRGTVHLNSLKNLGQKKVNTDDNDLYPKIIRGLPSFGIWRTKRFLVRPLMWYMVQVIIKK